MGTSSELVRLNADGVTVDRIHLSYDGYLSGVGLKLFHYYDTPEKVTALFGCQTAATSLEAEPRDMLWDEWDESYRGKSLTDFIAEERKSAIYYNTPDNPEAGEKLVAALAATGLVAAHPPVLMLRGAILPIGSISVGVDVRQLPQTLRDQLPAIVEVTFGRALPASYFLYGSIGGIANHAAVPEDFNGDSDDEDSSLGYYVWAHGRWAYPKTVTEMQTFFATGESPNILTRQFFLDCDEGVVESDLDTVPTPSRPINEKIGVLTILDDGGVTLTVDTMVYEVGAAPGFVAAFEPEEINGKTVRVIESAAFSSSDGKTSRQGITINHLELVQ